MPYSSKAGAVLLSLLPKAQPSFLKASIIGGGCAAVAGTARYFLEPYISSVQFITFFPCLVIAAILADYVAGGVVIAVALIFAVVRFFMDEDTWSSLLIAMGLFSLVSGLIIVVIHALHRAIRALHLTKEHCTLLASEMKHRVMNMSQLTHSLAQMTAMSSSDLDDFLERFLGRNKALSEAHRLSAGDTDVPTSLKALSTALMMPYAPQIDLPTEDTSIPNEVAPNLALVIHELATNAAKYGALSTPNGRVSFSWTSTADGLSIRWQESGGPTVVPPTRIGFGSKLMREALAGVGKIEMTYDPHGLQFQLFLPRQRKS